MLTNRGWRQMEKNQEWFGYPRKQASLQYTMLDCRALTTTALSLFNKFIPQELVEEMLANVDDNALHMKRRQPEGNVNMIPSLDKAYAALAVQVRLLGLQQRSLENVRDPHHYQRHIQEALNHFTGLGYGHAPARDSTEKLLAHMLVTAQHTGALSKNFQQVVLHLGQSVAGDEKLFHFTGESPNVRLVISKPGRVGLWFYELTGALSNGLPYLLDVFMHTNVAGPIKVASVVDRWVTVMKTCGSDAVDTQRDRCILACDSYYLDATSRSQLLASGVTFTASVRGDRFKREVHAVHRPGTTDQLGDYSGIYHPGTAETFVFHYDPETGVGRKYNYARGFQRITDRAVIQAHRGHIPVYFYYKVLYGMCDQFNRALHDRCWPYKRGGHGRKGELGAQNDFLMGCVLQNVINAFCAIQGLNRADVEFKEFCVNLADELFKKSRDFVGK